MQILKNIQEKITDLKAPRRLHIFSIKDTKANEFNAPFFQNNHETAIRIFRTEINRAEQTNLAFLYPEDFDLYYLGHINLDTGEITDEVTLIAKGPTFKAKPTP